MPCNANHVREALSITLHSIGCAIWVAALVIILNAHRSANDFYTSSGMFIR